MGIQLNTLSTSHSHCSGYKPHSRVSFLAVVELILFKSIQNSSSAYQALPHKTLLGVKWPECEDDSSNSHQLSADIKSVYHYTSISSYTFMAQYTSREKFSYYPGLNKSCWTHMNRISVLQYYRPVTYNFLFQNIKV